MLLRIKLAIKSSVDNDTPQINLKNVPLTIHEYLSSDQNRPQDCLGRRS